MAKRTNRHSPAGSRPLAVNRKARRQYRVLERIEAGIELLGTEVKSIRGGKIQLRDSYVAFRNHEAWLVDAHISAYSHGNRENHELERPRRLLLNRREIDRLFGRTRDRGLTVVPLSVYLKANWIKVELALAEGRKLHDKRQRERERTLDREAREVFRGRRRMRAGSSGQGKSGERGP
ncbi:MAG: SsrA-binding protein SmpB [Acidobacteria bacterium]|nr:SsrA-binding protein SmpB [Acidobacteriota bacterium]